MIPSQGTAPVRGRGSCSRNPPYHIPQPGSRRGAREIRTISQRDPNELQNLRIIPWEQGRGRGQMRGGRLLQRGRGVRHVSAPPMTLNLSAPIMHPQGRGITTPGSFSEGASLASAPSSPAAVSSHQSNSDGQPDHIAMQERERGGESESGSSQATPSTVSSPLSERSISVSSLSSHRSIDERQNQYIPGLQTQLATIQRQIEITQARVFKITQAEKDRLKQQLCRVLICEDTNHFSNYLVQLPCEHSADRRNWYEAREGACHICTLQIPDQVTYVDRRGLIEQQVRQILPHYQEIFFNRGYAFFRQLCDTLIEKTEPTTFIHSKDYFPRTDQSRADNTLTLRAAVEEAVHNFLEGLDNFIPS